MFTALRPLIDAFRYLGGDAAEQALDVTLTMARETAEGQALELGWRDRNISDLTRGRLPADGAEEDGVAGHDLAGPSWALILGSRGRCDPERLMRWGYFLGVAFQIEDDLRNLSADPGYGKERNGDLYEAKRTLMLIHVRGATARRRIVRGSTLFWRARARRVRTSEVLWLAGLMEACGSIGHARARRRSHGRGRDARVRPGLRRPAAFAMTCRFLAGLANWVFERP